MTNQSRSGHAQGAWQRHPDHVAMRTTPTSLVNAVGQSRCAKPDSKARTNVEHTHVRRGSRQRTALKPTCQALSLTEAHVPSRPRANTYQTWRAKYPQEEQHLALIRPVQVEDQIWHLGNDSLDS